MLDQFRRFVAEIAGRNRIVHGAGFSPHKNRVIRFLIAGAINTLFGFAVYSVFIIAGVAVWLSLLAGMLFGTVFNFFTTGGYVFRDLSLGRFPLFVICYLFVYGMNLLLIELISFWLNSKILSQAILVLPIAALSYLLMARFVFVSGNKTTGCDAN